MKWPWISRRVAAEQLAREISRRADQVQRERAAITAAADARVTAITLERDWLRQRNEQLTDTIIAFKKDGFTIAAKGSIRQPRDVEGEALARVEGRSAAEFLENATQDIMSRTGASRTEAEREARRLREEAIAQHPSGG